MLAACSGSDKAIDAAERENAGGHSGVGGQGVGGGGVGGRGVGGGGTSNAGGTAGGVAVLSRATLADSLPDLDLGDLAHKRPHPLELAPLALPLPEHRLQLITSSSDVPNGAWSWFEDERAIVDQAHPSGPLLLVSSVTHAQAPSPQRGDVVVHWWNFREAPAGHFELHDRLECDDHDSAALYQRDDGRYLAMYSRHDGDRLSRWRVSTEPHDPSAWQPEESHDNLAGTTYANLLPYRNDGEQALLSFTRSVGWNPNVLISHDEGDSWSYRGRVFAELGRPYVKYASSAGSVHLFYTGQHPRNANNDVRHLLLKNDLLLDSFGAPRAELDADGAQVDAGTRVFEGSPDRVPWVIDLEVDASGRPYGVFSSQLNSAGEAPGLGGHDHRYHMAYFREAMWHVREIAYAGSRLYPGEDDYTGLVALDPHDPYCVYVSTNAHPSSGQPLISQADGKRHYELWRGHSSDAGDSWSWAPITESSTSDNLRPIMPRWDGEHRVLLWLRGSYDSYVEWDTQVVATAWHGGCAG